MTDFKMHCLFKGCPGIINISKEIRDCFYYSREQGNPCKIPWMIHSITCPVCMNPVGDFNIGPDCWCGVGEKYKKKRKLTPKEQKEYKESFGWSVYTEHQIHNPAKWSWRTDDKGKRKKVFETVTLTSGKRPTIDDYNPYLKDWARGKSMKERLKDKQKTSRIKYKKTEEEE